MRLLVIEDEPLHLAVLARALREAGYAVDTSEDGEDGLFKARSWEYDAIVLDVMLPRLDGWEVLRRLRQKKKTPVLMLTARDGSADRVFGLDAGADDYVVKPFDLPELLARLRALIRRSANEARSRIKIGDILIDTAARSVSRLGEDVALTARGMLLEYLTLIAAKSSPGRRYEHLFRRERQHLSTLDVHVSTSKKLGRDLIVTQDTVTDRSLAFAIDPPQREPAMANDVVSSFLLRNAGTLPWRPCQDGSPQAKGGRTVRCWKGSISGHRFHFDLPEVSKAVGRSSLLRSANSFDRFCDRAPSASARPCERNDSSQALRSTAGRLHSAGFNLGHRRQRLGANGRINVFRRGHSEGRAALARTNTQGRQRGATQIFSLIAHEFEQSRHADVKRPRSKASMAAPATPCRRSEHPERGHGGAGPSHRSGA